MQYAPPLAMAEPALEPTPIRQSDADLDGEVCELALLGGSPGPYSYLVPAEFTGRLSVGMRVLAEFPAESLSAERSFHA